MIRKPTHDVIVSSFALKSFVFDKSTIKKETFANRAHSRKFILAKFRISKLQPLFG